MANQFDKLPFNDSRQNSVPYANPQDILHQAMRNPQAFEENLRQNNPQAYQQAMQIRNSANPRAVIVEMAKSRGINPSILKMFGL